MRQEKTMDARIIRRIGTVLLVCVVFSSLQAQERCGTISGVAVNSATKEPVPFVNVTLSGTKFGAATDVNGSYRLVKIPAGSYTVTFQSVAFARVTQTDVLVRPNRITTVDAELHEQTVGTAEVVVEADYFSHDETKPLSVVSFNAEEVRRAPGSAGDVSRILQALPSVAQVSDQANDLMVRGGSPSENIFFIDGIQVPNVNHFPRAGFAGGAIGIINVDFLDNVTFHTGGFPAEYGNRLSSVVSMKLRDGSRDSYDGQIDMNIAGFGGVIEGPLPGGTGSWFLSARRSYLDVVTKLIGTSAGPRYGDVHAKCTYDIDPANRISFLNIFGTSSQEFDKKAATDDRSPTYGTSASYQNTAGLSWRRLWSGEGYSYTTLSYSFMKSREDWNDLGSDRPVLGNDYYEGYVQLRNTNYIRFSQRFKMETGVDAEAVPLRYKNFYGAQMDRLGAQTPAYSVDTIFSTNRWGAFTTLIWNPTADITVSVGLRGDRYERRDGWKLSPRVSGAWQLTDRLSVNASAGIFYQNLPGIILAQSGGYSAMEIPKAVHSIAGINYMLTEETKLSIEGYIKRYTHLPLTPSDPSLSVIDDGRSLSHFGHYTDLIDAGRAESHGIEVLVQKKMAREVYGMVSASVFRSRYRGYDGVWRNRAWDNRYLFTIIGGYKPNAEWEASVRWGIGGGLPYTPFDLARSIAANEGIVDNTRINAERTPPYHSLNVRVDRRFLYRESNLVAYVSVMNVYNRRNIVGYFWDTLDRKPAEYFLFSFLPIIGFEYEF
jgi:hypothetical protein